MKKLNLKIEYILIAVLTIGLILIAVSFFRQLNFSDNSKQIERGERIEVVDGDTLEQKFIAESNGLSSLKILFGGKPLREYNSLKFTLADKDCKSIISEKTLKGKYDFNSKYLYNFNFPLINNSQDKEYCLKIKLTTEKKWSLWRKVKNKISKNKDKGKQKIRLFKSDSGRAVNGKELKTIGYIIKNENRKEKSKGDSSIVFRQSFESNTLLQDFQQLNQRISQYKPWFLKGRWLTMIVIIAGVLTIKSIWLLVKKTD